MKENIFYIVLSDRVIKNSLQNLIYNFTNMKTTNKFLVTIVTITLLMAAIWTTNAIYWNWNWSGKWQWQGQWHWQWQWMMNSWNGQQLNKQNHNPWDLISTVATWVLSEQEKQDLYYQYNEEKVARDLYTHFFNLYWVQIFQNIGSSEQKHMDAVKVLLDRYSLSVPTSYGELQDEYDSLKVEWEKWLKEALEVGLKVEMLDIKDIVDTIKSTDNDDLKIIFTNIWWASYNHMRWFLKWLANNSLTTSIDYSSYLTQDELNSKWSLKYKLAEKLESEWVVLPTQSSSKYIKENCKNEEQWMWNGQWQWKYQQNTVSQKNKLQNQRKNLYKSQIEKKYGNTIKNANQNKLNALEWKIDKVIESVNNSSTLTTDKKEKYLDLYNSLKEYLGELR